MDRERLYDFVFHYNPMTKMWNSVPRDSYRDYWNGKCMNCKKNRNLRNLIKEIIK